MTDLEGGAGSASGLGWRVFAASFVVLLLELALIRWLPMEVRVVAYFPNVVLLSAFLGLGLGALRARAGASLLWLSPVGLVVLVCTAASLSGVAFSQREPSEHLWLLYFDLGPDAPMIESVRLPIMLLFLLSTSVFIGLGQYVARLLQEFRALGRPLHGYAWDLGGSLCGVLVLSTMSWLAAPPWIWFAVALAVAVPLVQNRRAVALLGVAGAVVLTVIVLANRNQVISPYYAISLAPDPKDKAVSILTNGSLHQSMLPLGSNSTPANLDQKGSKYGYHTPYRLLGRPPGKVLVLGAGSGNDVAVALDNGASEVHAVEIDPVIVDIGRRLHPDHPYSDPRVKLRVTDARAVLNDTTEHYQLIVFGTLDSMTKLSALASVRLDSFVYTRQAIAAAHSRLAPDGGIVMYFMVGEPYIDTRLRALLESEFGEPPVVITGGYRKFNRIYLSGPAFRHLTSLGFKRVSAYGSGEVLLPDDDWPFLYLRRRAVTGFYLSLIAAIGMVGLASVLVASGELRRSLTRDREIDLEMLLFGIGFLLLETRFISAMNLVWGSTWITSAVVFGSILLTVLLATLLMHHRPMTWTTGLLGLLLALGVTFLTPLELLVGKPAVVRLAASIVLVGGPLFFAAVCFAIAFAQRRNPGLAFGWNLIGAVLGGLLELASMAIGLRLLGLVVIAAYAAVAWLHARSQEPAAMITATSAE